MIFSRIAGTGSYLPANVVSNEELARRVDTSDEWIRSRTGIRQLHRQRVAARDNSLRHANGCAREIAGSLRRSR